jgi:hypothetical protein
MFDSPYPLPPSPFRSMIRAENIEQASLELHPAGQEDTLL